MTFLERLDLLKSRTGDNNSTLAKRSGIPYTTIDGLYKKGYSNTKLSTLEALCAYFNVTLDYLVFGTEEAESDYYLSHGIATRGKSAEWNATLADIEHSRALGAQDEDESIIITTYRALTDEQKKAFKRFLKFIKEENDT